MALDWKNDPTQPQPTEADLEALAASISDVRYGSTAEAEAVEVAEATETVEAAEAAEAAPISALNFILDTEEDKSEPVTPEPTAEPEPAAVAASAPSPAPTAPAPVSLPDPIPAEIPHGTSGHQHQGDRSETADADANGSKKQKKSLLARLNEPIDAGKAASGVGSLLSGRGGSSWPTKTSINLYVRSERELNPRKIILVSVLSALAIVAFLKFGVFDQLARVTAKELEYADYQTQLVTLQSQLTDYDEVREQYEAYNVQTSSTDIDVLGALDMVDRVVRPSVTIVSEQVDGNVLTLVLTGSSLDTYGSLVTALSGETQVSGVSVRTADNTSADSTSDVTATLTVTLFTITQVDMLTGGSEGLSADTEESSSASTLGDYVDQTVSNVTEFGADPNMDVED